jgi:hypothetical protein
VDYETFRIRLQPARAGSYRVLASAPRGETDGEFRLPFDERDLKIFVLEVGRTRRGVRSLNSPEMETARSFGATLFDELFRGDVRDVYHTASAEAEAEGKGLRITLHLSQAPELMHVPWEYLCEDGRFLSVSERTPIVRYLDLKKTHRPVSVALPLRIVAMVSSPTDVVELDVEEEKRRLERALEALRARGEVEIVWLENATLTALYQALEREDFHVLHYIGHGHFDERLGDGALILEDRDGRPAPVTGMKLGQILQDERTLRLAVLNACEGARTDREDPFAGVAASLVRNEIPSVIAMQFEITDDAAIVFAEGFYSALARGAPVDAALASARKAIWADSNDVEWGTPVLFMRIPDGRVFDIRGEVSTDVEVVVHEEPALDVRLSATPQTVVAGEEVTWVLTITNVGEVSLKDVTAFGSDGSTLVDESEFQPGRRSVTRWRTRPEESAETTVTTRATDAVGNRIAEQVAAHVLVRPATGVAAHAAVGNAAANRSSRSSKPAAPAESARPPSDFSADRGTGAATATRKTSVQKSIDRQERKKADRAPARQSRQPKADARRRLVLDALAAIAGEKGVHFAPHLPRDRLDVLRRAMNVPKSEEIVVLVDLSASSTGKGGVLFGLDALYSRAWGDVRFIPYTELKRVSIPDRTNWSSDLKLGDNHLTLSGIKFSEGVMIGALRTLKAALAGKRRSS